MAIDFTLNRQRTGYSGDPAMPLLWYLRDHARLTGTKFGCGIGYCGACTVHIDGAAARSCITPMSRGAGGPGTTIERGARGGAVARRGPVSAPRRGRELSRRDFLSVSMTAAGALLASLHWQRAAGA